MLRLVVGLGIPVVILGLVVVASKGPGPDYFKLARFECGFEALTISRVPFSIKYFLVILLFLVFDVEVVLVLPLVPLPRVRLVAGLVAGAAVLCVLFTGLVLEALQGSLQ